MPYQGLEKQEKQEERLTQMLEFTEQQLRENMEVLRRDLGAAMDGTRKKMEEAIGQAGSGGRGGAAVGAAQAALDSIDASASLKPSTDVVATLRVRAWSRCGLLSTQLASPCPPELTHDIIHHHPHHNNRSWRAGRSGS